MSAVWRLMAAAAVTAACGAATEPSVDTQAVTAVCVDGAALAPEGALFCSEARALECASPRGAPTPTLYFVPDARTCADWRLSPVASATWLAPGTHALESVATARALDATFTRVCRATVMVLDTRPPRVTAAPPVSLWPPNHRFHHVTPRDCVTVSDACDEAPRVFFTWAASDEPADATGDGHTVVDMQSLGCDGVDLLAERRGNGDGRVYTLGYRAVDRSGNATDGVCTVAVRHDQSGRAAASSGEAYRIPAPESCDPRAP